MIESAQIKWDSPEGVKWDTAPSHDVKWDEPQDGGIGSFLATKAERGIKGVAQSILQFAKDLSLNDSLMRQAPFAKDAKTRGGEKLVTASPDTIPTAIERLQQTRALIQPDDPQTDSTALRFAGDVVETLPQVGVQIAASLIGGPVLGTETIGAQIAGAQSRELEQSGVRPERRLKAGAANALMQAPLEQIGVGKVLGVSSIAKLGGAMVTEFVTEVVQKYPELATNIWAETEGSTLSERADQFVNGLAQATKDGLYEGAVAATIGGAAGGVNLASSVVPKNIKWDAATDPAKLADAVGKPEQISHLEKIGIKDKEAQAREIIRDAVEQPENLAKMAAAKGKTDLAEQLHQKAVVNGSKLKAADGIATEKAVNSILGVAWDEPAVAGASVGKYSEAPAIIEMPEIVGMAKDLLGGKYPELVQKFRKRGVLGLFQRDGRIQLRADIAEDTNQASKVLAHEIGHAVDWLPDETLSRGNILGRVASLKKYMKNQVAFKPVNLEGTTQGPLTTAERAQLAKEARVLAKKDSETLIDEVIKKEVPVSPDDVLAILKGLELEKEPNADLTHFIFTADTATKKSIALQAMKGLSPQEVSHLTDTVEVKTGNKIAQGKPTEKEIREKYKGLVKNEIARRMLFDKETITAELKKHTLEWRPFTPHANNKFTAYRHSSPELYADAISALITSPKTLERNAPTFYRAFFNHMESKPEVKRVWEGIQDAIRTGNVSENRISSDYEMFQRGHDAREQARVDKEKAPESAFDTLARGLWDRNHATLKELRKQEKVGGEAAKHARETRYNLEEIQYISSEADAYMNDFNQRIQKPIEADGISVDDLGVYMMRRHIETNREGLFSSKGYTPETVKRDLDVLREKWGPEKYGKVEQAANEYRKIREESIIPLLEESGLATPELVQVIKDRDNYSRVSVIKYLEGQLGRGTTAKIYKQIGTLEEVENPLVATVLQDMSMMRAARINIAKRGLVKDLTETGSIEPAEMKYSQDRKGFVPVDPKDRSIGVYTVMVDGKPQHYYTAKPIVDAFQFQPFEATQIARTWGYLSQPIRDIMVSKNPVWMARNVFRDFRETVKKIPDIKLRHTMRLAKEYKLAWKEVWAEAANKKRSDTIQTMMRGRMLTPDRVFQPKEMNFDDELQRIADGFNLSAKADRESVEARGKLLRAYRFADKLGRASELAGKVAGYNYLKKYTAHGDKEIGHLTRSRIGTPDFKRQGEWQTVTNNIFMFSNVNKEGVRANVEAYRENPTAYVWKTLATNVLPKALLAAGIAGATGPYYKKILNGIPEYDLSNYTVIPLYLDENGKSVYLRIPEDYEGQFFGALAWKLAHLELLGSGGAVSAIAEHNPYQSHPIISTGKALADYYLRGQNPVDDFRGQQVLSDRVFTAGGADATAEMAKHAWRGLGGSIIYDPPRSEAKKQQSAFEKYTRSFPGNILGTFVKTSDRGISEKIDKDLAEYRKTKARIGIDTDSAMVKLANGEQITKEELALVLAQKNHVANKKMQKLMLQQHGSALSSAIARARSKEEVLVILNAMEKQNGR